MTDNTPTNFEIAHPLASRIVRLTEKLEALWEGQEREHVLSYAGPKDEQNDHALEARLYKAQALELEKTLKALEIRYIEDRDLEVPDNTYDRVRKVNQLIEWDRTVNLLTVQGTSKGVTLL